MSRFPRASGRLYKKKIYKEIEVKVYCICRYPDVNGLGTWNVIAANSGIIKIA